MERAVVLCPLGTIMPGHLPPAVAAGAAARPAAPPASGGAAAGLNAEIRAVERARILETLAATGGNQSETARRLGMARGTLIARLNEYGIPRPRRHDAESDA